MKSLLCFVPLFALALASCSSPNNTTVINNDTTIVNDAAAPKIARFSPDTVWTFGLLTIYGNHLGLDGNDVNVAIDTAQAGVRAVDDTIMTVYAPEQARTGLIHVLTINGSCVSQTPVIVKYTFYPHPINDTLPIGASFSIPGTGMNNYLGVLHLSVAGITYPIDSVFPDRIVSHVVENGLSGSIRISDSSGVHLVGALTITRPSAWKTLSEIWDHVTLIEEHTRATYVNGVAVSDSTWTSQASFSGQHDVNISGIPFSRTSTGLTYSLPYLLLNWDTVRQTATIQFTSTVDSTTATYTIDSTWGASGQNLPAPLPVDNDVEFVLPSFSRQVTQDSLYNQELVWRETTSLYGRVSGNFDLIFKQ